MPINFISLLNFYLVLRPPYWYFKWLQDMEIDENISHTEAKIVCSSLAYFKFGDYTGYYMIGYVLLAITPMIWILKRYALKFSTPIRLVLAK